VLYGTYLLRGVGTIHRDASLILPKVPEEVLLIRILLVMLSRKPSINPST
jgi:hypothetical protein